MRIRPNIKLAIVAMLFFAVVTALRADTITVTNTNDSGPGSLRQALANANDGDIIDFAVTGTIGLTSGELLVDKSITISGPGPDNLAVDGNAKSRVFHIDSITTVAISGLTITDGNASGQVPDGGGIYNDHGTLTLSDCALSNNSAFRNGGGIDNDGDLGSARLTINSCVINGNLTGNDGGGICNDGTAGSASLEVSDSVLSDNSGAYGGAILNDARQQGTALLQVSDSILSSNFGEYGGAIFTIADLGNKKTTLALSNCTVSGNSADSIAGGIYNQNSTLTLSSCTVSGNSTQGYGGGLYSAGFGNATLQNSTISGNSAVSFGGGIVNDVAANLTISTSTFSDNSANSGGGIYSDAFIWIGNTILKAGAAGENIVNGIGFVISNGYNLCSDDGGGYLTGPGDQVNTDPLLGPLQNNGGPNLTHALLPGSPAIDAGDPSFTPPPFNDQRGPGFDRVVHGHIDIGSFEVQSGGTTPTPTPTATPTATPTPRLAPTPRPRPTPHPRPTQP